MAAIAGFGGSLKQGANTVANITEWNLDVAGKTEETTAFQTPGGWRQETSTIKEWTAKCNGHFDSTDINGQVVLINGILTSFALTFMTDAVHNWAGNGILTNINPKTPAKGVATIEFSFMGNGAI